MSNTTDEQEEAISQAQKVVFEAVKECVEESLWVGTGGDYEDVFGEDVKFDASDMSVTIRGRRFVLSLTETADEKPAKKQKVDKEESKQ
jgi:hypothetical protein